MLDALGRFRGHLVTEEFEPIEAEYGEQYLDWKDWGSASFGELSRSTRIYYEAELKRAGVLNRNDLNVLEVGFGNGDFMWYCRSRKWQITGTEINPELVSIARAEGYDAHPSSETDALPADTFDLIVTIDVLEHIPPEGAADFLRMLLAKLKPGGALIAHFPNGDSPFGLYNQNGDATHVNAIGSGKARFYAQSVGAEIVFIGGEARPIPAGAMKHTVQRLIALPFHKVLNALVRVIFLPATRADFSATALTMILRKPQAA